MATADYATDAERNAYDSGYDRAHALAANAEIDTLDHDEDEDGPLDEQTVYDILWEAESHDRQMSPFEFTAAAFNDDEENADAMWDAYDNGLADGMREGVDMTALLGTAC
jgi:hypothetical protein